LGAGGDQALRASCVFDKVQAVAGKLAREGETKAARRAGDERGTCGCWVRHVVYVPFYEKGCSGYLLSTIIVLYGEGTWYRASEQFVGCTKGESGRGDSLLALEKMLKLF
jgi:hypothetical protein